ncbi:hypothetical protein [Virgisporangium aurantiacum]|uniref:Uncharacterized protein n=1 Tax=Virgisporangium aurantiacum TaxID=175570 RepID=A0A8J4E6E6_9ACTN|nr:hypothetical protein [Virgisporangium aurantiacum]GIJ63341.1 hypothetical protein Vau01_108570 [Virgisporangium aurantiacum]
MSDTETRGGFSGEPAAALSAAGSSGCCGNPAQTTNIALPDAGSPCCGTPAEAEATGSCCGTTAKAEAVASGTGCCG